MADGVPNTTAMLLEAATNGSEEDTCAIHDPVNVTRFALVFGAGSSIAVFGGVANIILAARLVFPGLFGGSRNTSSKFPTLYLAALAILDASICVCYVLIMGVDALGLYMRWEWLYLAWTYYGIPVFTISRIVQLSSSWVIVAATVERLGLILSEKCGRGSRFGRLCRRFASHKSRSLTISLILLLSFVFRCCTLLELEIVNFPRCPAARGRFGGIAIQQVISPSEGVYYVFDFYVVNLIQVVIPITGLLILNMTIIRALKRRYTHHEVQRKSLPGKIREVYRDKFFKPRKVSRLSEEEAAKLGGIRRIIQEAELNQQMQVPRFSHHDGHVSTDAPSEGGDAVAPEVEDVMGFEVSNQLLVGEMSRAKSGAERKEEGDEGEMVPLVLGVAATAVYLQRMTNEREREVDLRSLNSATYTFLWIAGSYLACNSLSLFVSLLERLPGKPLLMTFSSEYKMDVPNQFYVVTTDIISFLFMFCTFLRPIIYVKFNTHIRIDWGRHFRRPFP